MSTVIVGQRALLREGVASLLQHTPYRVIASAARALELGDVRVPTGRRVLVILGIEGANGNFETAAENISVLRSRFSDARIVLVAETNGPVDMQRILALAPDGFILNLGSGDILLRSLELTLMDQQVIVLGRPTAPPLAGEYAESGPAGLTDMPSGRGSRHSSGIAIDAINPQLSLRERQVLTRLAQGDSNKAIARVCNITESTVKVHLKAILRKVAAHNRTQAAIWAVANGYQNSTPPADRATVHVNGSAARSQASAAPASAQSTAGLSSLVMANVAE